MLSTSNMYLAFIGLLLMCWLFAIIHFCVKCSVRETVKDILLCCLLVALLRSILTLLLSFTDFAVGAPYHSTGTVSIWTGSETGISPKPSQVR